MSEKRTLENQLADEFGRYHQTKEEAQQDMRDPSKGQGRDEGWMVMVQDDSCHWYLIPAERRAEWASFVETVENGDGDADTPAWATPLGGGPSLIEFFIWRIAK